MHATYCRTSPSRRGLTLIELLVVAFILVLFVAVAAPLLKPNTEDRKVREAARQVNAILAEARAYAAQQGRPMGVAFDRYMATREGARDSNIITRMYFAEVPPKYSGDITNAQVRVWREPTQPVIAGYTPPPINGNPAKMIVLEFKYYGSIDNAMLDSIVASYMGNPSPGDVLPFTIQLDGGGTHYSGCVVYGLTPPPGIPGRAYNYFCWAPFGSQLYTESVPDMPPPPYPAPPPPTDPPQPIPPAHKFEMAFPPIPSPGSPLELPDGTAVDLQFSGYGQSGTQLYDPYRSSNLPLVVLFDPSGNVASIQDRSYWGAPQGRMHFLVGTVKNAVDSLDATSGYVTLSSSNLAESANLWISISTRTGHVATADNLQPSTLPAGAVDPSTAGTAIQQARGFATGLNTKGGR